MFTPRVRQEVLDADYLAKLNAKELAWYNKFINEYVNASITKHKSNGRIKKGHLHKTKDKVKEIYDANNKRNNDLFGVTKINGLLEYWENDSFDGYEEYSVKNPQLTEESLNAYIDNKKYKRKRRKKKDD